LKPRISFFQQQPTAGAKRVDHEPNCPLALGNMHENKPSVNEIEHDLGRRLSTDVVAQDFVVTVPGPIEPRCVNVGRKDEAAGSDGLCNPLRHARAAGANLPCTPSRRDTQPQHMSKGRGIKERGKRIEAFPGFSLLIIEQVVPVIRHDPILRIPALTLAKPLSCQCQLIGAPVEP
jgi:hypothetical protein